MADDESHPLSRMHSSRCFFVSGHAQQIFFVGLRALLLLLLPLVVLVAGVAPLCCVLDIKACWSLVRGKLNSINLRHTRSAKEIKRAHTTTSQLLWRRSSDAPTARRASKTKEKEQLSRFEA